MSKDKRISTCSDRVCKPFDKSNLPKDLFKIAPSVLRVNWNKDAFIDDVYQGKVIEIGEKKIKIRRVSGNRFINGTIQTIQLSVTK